MGSWPCLIVLSGLGYDVVMKPVAPPRNQGYHLYFDNFYTSVKLVKNSFQVLIQATGKAAENGREFPETIRSLSVTFTTDGKRQRQPLIFILFF